MKTVAWPCPAPGGSGEEFALVGGPEGAATRLLIIPALFEEANRTRRMLVQAMRLIAGRGAFAALPDVPGCNESLAPLERQRLDTWRAAAALAARNFAATHVLTLRGGALIAPAELPGWRLASITGAQVLRPMLRAAVLAAREGGRSETVEALLARGREEGLDLAGYRLGAGLISALEQAALPSSRQADIALAEIGGPALWLRSEPGEDATLSAGVAGLVGNAA